VLATGGCGGAKGGGGAAEQYDFDCRNRRMAYIATGHFAGPEVGVVVDCAERGPRIKRWVVMDVQAGEQTGEQAGEQAGRQTNQHSLTAREFDRLWEKFDSTGWRMLGDCDNPAAVEGDPAYKFGIQDHNGSVSLACAGKTLPFPFDRMLNELDLLVAQYGL
jgi:hypothetical protein